MWVYFLDAFYTLEHGTFDQFKAIRIIAMSFVEFIRKFSFPIAFNVKHFLYRSPHRVVLSFIFAVMILLMSSFKIFAELSLFIFRGTRLVSFNGIHQLLQFRQKDVL